MKDILDEQMKDALLSIQGETAIIAVANNRPSRCHCCIRS